jgi:hypothetical protein
VAAEAAVVIHSPSRKRPRLRRGNPLSKATLVRSTFDSCRADRIEAHSAYGPLPDSRGAKEVGETQSAIAA